MEDTTNPRQIQIGSKNHYYYKPKANNLGKKWGKNHKTITIKLLVKREPSSSKKKKGQIGLQMWEKASPTHS